MKFLKFNLAPLILNSDLPKKKFWSLKKALKYAWQESYKVEKKEEDDKAYTAYNFSVCVLGLHIGMIFLSKKNPKGYILSFFPLTYIFTSSKNKLKNSKLRQKI